VGVLFLLRRMVPGFYPWPVIWKYWPLLLILVGAGMIWDRTQRQNNPQAAPSFPVGSALGMVAFLLLLTFLLWHGHSYARHDWANVSAGAAHGEHESEVVELKGAKAVRMTVHLPAGQLQISGGAERLLEADFHQGPSWSPPTVEYSVDKGLGRLTIEQQGSSQLITNSDNTWKLRVSNEVPLELEVDVGAGRSDLNLARVDLTRMELNIGAGQANVDLTGERGKDLKAQIHGGVGEAVVRLPKNVGVVAVVHGGLGSIDVHGLKEEGGEYTNSAYGKSPNTIHLTVEGGIGHIQLEQE
jgi:hypothetical protein